MCLRFNFLPSQFSILSIEFRFHAVLSKSLTSTLGLNEETMCNAYSNLRSLCFQIGSHILVAGRKLARAICPFVFSSPLSRHLRDRFK